MSHLRLWKRWWECHYGTEAGPRGRSSALADPLYSGLCLDPPGSDGQIVPRAALTRRTFEKLCVPNSAGHRLLVEASKQMGLSACGIHRVLKVARTVADLEGEERVRESQIAEALQYRSL